MKPLVLLILAAVWAAVLLPPLLRNRIENRPNSSVTDFRRQLNKLQNTVPSRGGNVSMARPLAPSPLSRPAAAGRPGDPTRRQHGDLRTRRGAPERAPVRERSPQSQRYARSHGDRSAMLRRPSGSFDRPAPGNTPPRGRRRPTEADRQVRRPAHRQTHVHRDGDVARRRRSNVLIALGILTLGSFFFAAQTRSTTLLSVFALSFVALCGFLYMLSQARSRETQQWGNDWIS